MDDKNQNSSTPQNDQNQNENDQYQDILNKYADIINSQPSTEEEKVAEGKKDIPAVQPEPKTDVSQEIDNNIDKNVDQVNNSLVNSSQIESIKPSEPSKPMENESTSVEPKPVVDSPDLNPTVKTNTSPVLSHNIDVEENNPISKPVENIPELPKKEPELTKPEPIAVPEPTKTPEELKAELMNIINTPTSNESVSGDTIVPNPDSLVTPSKSATPYKILFFISLIIFLGVASALAYNLFFANKNISENSNNSQNVAPTSAVEAVYTCTLNDQKYKTGEYFSSADNCNTCTCQEDGTISCTDNICSATKSATTVTPAKTATVSSASKTSFQKLITNWTSYKELTTSEKNDVFTNCDDNNCFWPGLAKSNEALYSFAQKLIKGSVKKFVVNKTNLTTIFGDYSYDFYLTPNYGKWTNDQFKKSNFIPLTGIGDLSPVYAYTDKLIWSTSLNCGGIKASTVTEQKAQDQCESLVKEINTAFP